MTITCENCDWTGDARGIVRDISDLQDRLGPNPKVLLPVGECPACGAFVYDPSDVEEYERRERKIEFVDELLRRWSELRRSPDELDEAMPGRMLGAGLVDWIDGGLQALGDGVVRPRRSLRDALLEACEAMVGFVEWARDHGAAQEATGAVLKMAQSAIAAENGESGGARQFVRVHLAHDDYVVPADRPDMIEEAQAALRDDVLSAVHSDEIFCCTVSEAPNATAVDRRRAEWQAGGAI